MSDQRIREGGCGCGAVRYRVRGEPIMVHNCYCLICQRETGSASAVNGMWASDAVEVLSGVLDETALPGGSGQDHVLCRCRQCGLGVFVHYPRLGRLMTAIRAGTLDEPGTITPDVAIFTETKPAWAALPEGMPAFAQYYDFREVLPPERQERLSTLAALAARRKAGEE